MKQCKQIPSKNETVQTKSSKKDTIQKRKRADKKRFEKHTSANKKVSKIPTKNSAKHLK